MSASSSVVRSNGLRNISPQPSRAMATHGDFTKQDAIDTIKAIHADGFAYTKGALEIPTEKEHIIEQCFWFANQEYCKIAPWLVQYDIDPAEVEIIDEENPNLSMPLSFCYPEYRKVNLDENPGYEGNKTGEWLVCGHTPIAPYGADDYSWLRVKCETWDRMIRLNQNDEVQ